MKIIPSGFFLPVIKTNRILDYLPVDIAGNEKFKPNLPHSPGDRFLVKYKITGMTLTGVLFVSAFFNGKKYNKGYVIRCPTYLVTI